MKFRSTETDGRLTPDAAQALRSVYSTAIDVVDALEDGMCPIGISVPDDEPAAPPMTICHVVIDEPGAQVIAYRSLRDILKDEIEVGTYAPCFNDPLEHAKELRSLADMLEAEDAKYTGFCPGVIERRPYSRLDARHA